MFPVGQRQSLAGFVKTEKPTEHRHAPMLSSDKPVVSAEPNRIQIGVLHDEPKTNGPAGERVDQVVIHEQLEA
jgi:hypothetical protein